MAKTTKVGTKSKKAELPSESYMGTVKSKKGFYVGVDAENNSFFVNVEIDKGNGEKETIYHELSKDAARNLISCLQTARDVAFPHRFRINEEF